MELDIEAFIFEVQQRPAIRDVASDEYSNREKKKNAWEELVNIFIINKQEPSNDKKKISVSTILNFNEVSAVSK